MEISLMELVPRQAATCVSPDKERGPSFEFQPRPFYALCEEPKYEDLFVKVFADRLVVRDFYFPTLANRVVPIGSIRSVVYRRQCSSGQCTCGARRWGQARGSNMWWALDSKRCQGMASKSYNVVIDNGEARLKSFTTDNLSSFLGALRPLLPPWAAIVDDQAPFSK